MIPSYQDILVITRNAQLGHDTMLYSPSKGYFTVKKNIVVKETPKEFATEFAKLLNNELQNKSYNGKCKILSTKRDYKTDELIFTFKVE